MVATIRNLTSSSATVKYFRYEAGYYIGSDVDAGALRAKREEHREASAWHGCGAEALGLKPGARVSSRAFERLLQGHVPGTEIRLGRVRHGGYERRPGFDLTFSAPKSVSLAALLPTERHPRGDRSVVRAHDEAVRVDAGLGGGDASGDARLGPGDAAASPGEGAVHGGGDCSATWPAATSIRSSTPMP